MDTHKFNDLSPSKETMRSIKIAEAKKILKSEGYFVDNLWQNEDVKINYHCTEKQAQKILNRVFNYHNIYELVWEGIDYEAEKINLKHRD
jgi:hypothetical protein